MAQAIRKVDLEPFLVKPSREENLRATLYAYVKGKVPILMGILLADGSKDNFTSPAEFYGKHAIAVTGYSLGGALKPYPVNGFLLRASRIDKFYAHDDQVGPFSRIVLDMKEIEYLIEGKQDRRKSMVTSWKGRDGKIGSIRAIPEILLMPLYHKIRIPFESVHDTVMYFDHYIETVRKQGLISLGERVLWDIYLITNNDLKKEIFESNSLREKLKKDALQEHLPRYIWRASASCGGNKILDLLFDATDIEQAFFVKYVIGYDKKIFDEIVRIAKASRSMPRTKNVWKVLQYFDRIH
jgi:hypothetical protein